MTSGRFRRVTAIGTVYAARRLLGRVLLGTAILWSATTAAAITAQASGAAPLQSWQPRQTPVLALPALDGRHVDLSSITDHVVAVHFFATWCEPCRDELALLETLRTNLASRPFTILAVDVGEPEDRVRRFIDTVRVGFPILLDADKTALRAWDVSVLPTTFVLAPGGCGRWRAEGDHDWSAAATHDMLAAVMAERAGTSIPPALGGRHCTSSSTLSNGDRQ